MVLAPISPQTSEEPEWPDVDDLRKAQRSVDEVPPECEVDGRGLAVFGSGAIWVPDSDKMMQLRLLLAAHTGPGGHRGASTTLRGMETYVRWSSIEEDCKAFVASCLHCLSTTTGGKAVSYTHLTLPTIYSV